VLENACAVRAPAFRPATVILRPKVIETTRLLIPLTWAGDTAPFILSLQVLTKRAERLEEVQEVLEVLEGHDAVAGRLDSAPLLSN